MKFSPSIEEIKAIAATGAYKVAPVSCEILADVCTPIEAMQVLKNVSTHCYLLESAQANEKWGRYTFLGYDPKMEITCVDGTLRAGDVTLQTDDPSGVLRDILARYKSPRLPGLPTFTGGLVGYFSYDYLGYSEPKARTKAQDTENFKDVDLMLFDKVIAFDNLRQKIILIANMPLDEVQTNYNKATLELKRMADLLRHGEKRREAPGHLLGEVTPLFDKAAYCAMVERARRRIYEGDIFQIVLSNRLSAPFDGSLLGTYRMLRTINPSPYMFYFSGTDVEVAGASPETLVKLEEGVLHTFPLAGTRPRGKTDAEDAALEADLLADEKELPDLPYEEKEEFLPVCRKYGVDLISMIAPTSADRIAMIAKEAEGFLYIVSSLGVTGTRSEIKTDLASIVEVVRANTKTPCAIGFGISTPEQAHKMAAIADGAIVGSAIIKLLEQYGKDAPEKIGTYVKSMKDAL